MTKQNSIIHSENEYCSRFLKPTASSNVMRNILDVSCKNMLCRQIYFDVYINMISKIIGNEQENSFNIKPYQLFF